MQLQLLQYQIFFELNFVVTSLLNLSSDEVRLPLVKVTDETKKIVKSALSHANLI